MCFFPVLSLKFSTWLIHLVTRFLYIVCFICIKTSIVSNKLLKPGLTFFARRCSSILHRYTIALFVHTSLYGQIILLLYPDDMTIIGENIDISTSLKCHLQWQFQMRNLTSCATFYVSRSLMVLEALSLHWKSTYLIFLIVLSSLTLRLLLLLFNRMWSCGWLMLPDPQYKHQVGQFVYLCITMLDIAHMSWLVFFVVVG